MTFARIAAACFLFASAGVTLASRTGLNNVPDTDVSAAGTGVCQAYSNFGEDRDASFLTGVRLGFEPMGQQVELGWDARWEPGDESRAFFNVKWRHALDERGDSFALGVGNVAPSLHDRELTGEPQTYAVATAVVPFGRLHAGAAAQKDNPSVFAGFDHTWALHQHPLKVRSDITTTNGGHDWLASTGFTWRFHPHLNLEIWESFPTQRGFKPSTTMKLGVHFRF